MRLDNKDMARLWDMLDAARTAVEFIRGLQFERFLADRKTRNAVERNLEIIGEAARGLSQEVREHHADIPWKSMIALRNVLAHEYDEVRHEIIWRVCRDKLPALIQELQAMGVESILPKEEPRPQE